MMRTSNSAQGQSSQGRGYRVSYHANQANHCPGCGHSHWYVGRLVAECAFCSTALPIAASRPVYEYDYAIAC